MTPAVSCPVPIAQRGPCQEETADSCLLLSQRGEEADTLLWLHCLQRDKPRLVTKDTGREVTAQVGPGPQREQTLTPPPLLQCLVSHFSGAASTVRGDREPVIERAP